MTFHSPTLRHYAAFWAGDVDRTLNAWIDDMNNSRMSPKVNGPAWDQKVPFHLLVAYEDPGTRDRALHLSQHLSKQLEDEYDFHCSWWKFNHLTNTVLHEQAASAAREANMVVIAVQARPSPPAIQAEWLRSWVSERGTTSKAALVALVACPESGQTTDVRKTTGFLRDLAESAGMDFFNHSFELPKKPASKEATAAGGTMASPNASTPADRTTHFRMPIPRWGINE